MQDVYKICYTNIVFNSRGMTRQKNDGRGRLGGRQKGTPNKVTATLREWVADLLEQGADRGGLGGFRAKRATFDAGKVDGLRTSQVQSG